MHVCVCVRVCVCVCVCVFLVQHPYLLEVGMRNVALAQGLVSAMKRFSSAPYLLESGDEVYDCGKV